MHKSRLWRGIPTFVVLALVASFSLVTTTPAVASNGPPVSNGLVLHLDADAIQDLDDGDSVQQWHDLSGAGNHATQTEEANQPTYKTNVIDGKPVVRFDEDFLSLPLFQIGTSDGNAIFAVLRVVSPSDQRGGIVLGNFPETPNINAELHTSFRVRYFWNSGNPDHNPDPPTAAQDEPFVATWLRDAGQNQIRTGINGVLSAPSPAGSNVTIDVPFRIGVDYRPDPENIWFKGDIAEILIYDRALTDSERENVEGYLTTKWLEPPDEVWVCDTEGDDSNPGTFDEPFKTIQHGLTVVAEDGTVNVEPGTYGEHVTISNKSLSLRSTDGAEDTTITGLVEIELDDGQTVVFGGDEDAGFTVDRSDNNPVGDSAIVLSVDNGSDVTISHNTLTGADYGIFSETAFTIASGSNVVIAHNMITGNSSSGIYMGWIADSTVAIEYNTVRDNGAASLTTGMHIGEITNSDVSIEHNTITDNYGAGIRIDSIGQAFRTVTIAHNTIAGNEDEGINVGDIIASTLVIDDNVVQDNGRKGIRIDNVSDSSLVEIKANTIGGDEEKDGNGGAGIFISAVSDSTVTIGGDSEDDGNTISHNCKDDFFTGIHIDSVENGDVSIEHNTITDNYGAGVYIGGIGQAPGTVAIARNTIAGNEDEGIYVGMVDESTLIILGNVISDNETGIGIGDIQNSTVDVSFNNISSNSGFGMFVNAADEPAWATHNWWGDASGPFHDVHNPGGTGDEVSDDVTFIPWLGAAMKDQPAGCMADRDYGENASAHTDNVSAMATGGDDTTTVTVAEYVGNPTGANPGFVINDNVFVDVHVGGKLPDELVVVVNCPGGDCTEMLLRWFDGDAWQDVAPQQILNGEIQATLNEDSSPLISDLTGTPFAMGNPVPPPPAPPRPVVGGEAFAANKLALLAPWLAMIAAIGAGTAVAVRRRRVHS